MFLGSLIMDLMLVCQKDDPSPREGLSENFSFFRRSKPGKSKRNFPVEEGGIFWKLDARFVLSDLKNLTVGVFLTEYNIISV